MLISYARSNVYTAPAARNLWRILTKDPDIHIMVLVCLVYSGRL